MLIWVPAIRVAAGLAGLRNAEVEVVALGRDMGQAGGVGDVTIPASAAAPDVTDPEPLPPGHLLWSLSGVFLTPLVAAATPLSRRRAARPVREQAEAYGSGGPLRNVISDAC